MSRSQSMRVLTMNGQHSSLINAGLYAQRRSLKGKSQRGLSLIFALLALVAMTLGAVALVRSVDTGVLALGNVSQKQSTLVAASRGTEDAVAWLRARLLASSSGLDADIGGSGYYASAMPTLDATGKGAAAMGDQLVRVNWDDDGCKVDGVSYGHANCLTASDPATYNGVVVRYVAHRLCVQPGAVGGANSCATPLTDGEALVRCTGGRSQGCQEAMGPPAGPYYRVTVRAQGARGTVTFTETLINFN